MSIEVRLRKIERQIEQCITEEVLLTPEEREIRINNLKNKVTQRMTEEEIREFYSLSLTGRLDRTIKDMDTKQIHEIYKRYLATAPGLANYLEINYLSNSEVKS